ncbi:hypothetical protein CJ010_04905 [Azoarcus sp. DD4]|uniref:hypothetical protein n=1 Tax=Azoarcus sp. DD4 TaxID=2027405 RepID=UPI00112AE7BF|nr:hypothetical protein [Azoarcus sp. DD4]QDF95924.1 hypothetical protein CJ010_04905 [Azoarcus sp. DD4]
MSAPHLLLLDTHGLTIWQARGRSFDAVVHFSPGSDGPPAFAEWLAARAGSSRLTLIVDLPDETYELEHLPRARGSDREALIQRRLDQHSFGSPCGAALSLGTSTEAPPYENVLLCSLPRPEPLMPWLAVLAEQQARVTGVHLVAVVFDRLMSRLARRHPELQGRFLLVSEHAGSMRHSLFEHGRLRYSRLLAATDTGALQRTHAYLYAHDLIEHGANLRVVELLSQRHGAPCPPQPAVSAGIEYQTLESRSLCRELGIDCTDEADASVLLLLNQALRPRGLPHCAPAAVRQIDRLHRLGRRIGAAGFGIGIGAALLSAWLAAGNQHHAARINDLTTAANRQQLRHDSLLASLPPLPAPPGALGQVLDTLTQQTALDGDPQHLLAALGDALDTHPAIALRTLTWSRAPTPNARAGGAMTLAVALEIPPAESDPTQNLATLRSSILAQLARRDDIRTVLRPRPASHPQAPILDHQSGSSGGLHIELQDRRQEQEPS